MVQKIHLDGECAACSIFIGLFGRFVFVYPMIDAFSFVIQQPLFSLQPS